WEQFDQLWRPAGLYEAALAARAAMNAGDRAEAERIVRRDMLSHVCVTGPLDEAPDRFREWLAARVAVGVTTFAMPLEMPELLGVGPVEATAFADSLPEPARP
ncbi:MAG: hypothetical protein NZ518_03840, partial [Dehalococcoidia bacterium]|nr:hypothetical protein [Dehalococcoidia bacterium]